MPPGWLPAVIAHAKSRSPCQWLTCAADEAEPCCNVCIHRVLAAGRLGDAAELGSTAQDLDSQATALLSQAAGLRLKAARARRAARQSRLKAEALQDHADICAARLRHAQQAADVGAHAAQLLFLHCHILLLAAALQADAIYHKQQQVAGDERSER